MKFMRKWHIRHIDNEDYIFVDVKVANPMNPCKTVKAEFLVDTGASGCAISAELTEKLELQQSGYVDAGLADGSVKKVKAAYVLLEVGGKKLYTWTIYDKGFQPILGIDVMKVLGVHIDVPDKQVLVPFKNFKLKKLQLATNMRPIIYNVSVTFSRQKGEGGRP